MRKKKILINCIVSCVVLLSMFNPLVFTINDEGAIKISSSEAQALDVGVIGGMSMNANYSEGILKLKLSSKQLLGVGLLSNQYATFQFPVEFEEIINSPNLRENLKFVGRKPGLIGALGATKKTIKGTDKRVNIEGLAVSANFANFLGISLLGETYYTIEINIEKMGYELPTSRQSDNLLHFKAAVVDSILGNLEILAGRASKCTLGSGTPGEGVTERETEVEIGIQENNDPVNPVDPINPEIPVTPIDPINPDIPVKEGSNGPLSLDYAPALNFGNQKITAKDQFYYAKPQKVKYEDQSVESVPLYTQVTDKRGNSPGWSLSVKQNSQFKSNEHVLNGARIEFLNGQLNTTSESKVPSIINSNFDLTADGTGVASNVLVAKNGEGAGTFIYRFGDVDTKNTSVKLVVPGKTIKLKNGIYKTSLTWILNDTP